jgi:hypothetical protein
MELSTRSFRRGRLLVSAATFLLATVASGRVLAYDLHAIHKDGPGCPRGTTLARIESSPRQCREPLKRGIPATRPQRACCTSDRDASNAWCRPFPPCPRTSAE